MPIIVVADDLYEYGLNKLDNVQNADVLDEKFEKLVAEVRRRYPDVDWTAFQKYDQKTQAAFVRGVLAEKAYDEIRDKYMADLHEIANKKNKEIYTEKDDVSALYILVDNASRPYVLGGAGAQMHCEKACADSGGFVRSYYDGCGASFDVCENVTPIPYDYEEVWLQEDYGVFDDGGTRSDDRLLIYSKDSIADNTHIDYSVVLTADENVDDGNASAVVSRILSVGEFVSLFYSNRDIQNAVRQDIKNGKLLDRLQNDGMYSKKWNSVSPAGIVQQRTIDFFSQTDVNKSKNR